MQAGACLFVAPLLALRTTCTHHAVNAVCRGLNTHNFRPDFMTFNHRGTVLPHVLPDGHVLTASASAQ